MSEYISFDSVNININESDKIQGLYNQGFVLTRTRGRMDMVRSLRVDLSKFNLSSENRRILRKYNHELEIDQIPCENYHWSIGKMGFDFYNNKFGQGTFSANKLKELLTSLDHNFNALLKFTSNEYTEGYVISYSDGSIFHYCYPFYQLNFFNSNFGMYMMTKTLEVMKQKGYKYVYLGSLHSKSSLYKLQFSGIEWFDIDAKTWSQDILKVKNILNG